MPKITGPAKRLRIYLCEQDRRGGKPVYQEIVHKAKELGLAGATVFRGLMGYGANSIIHTVKIVDLSCDLPILVEIIDSEEYVNKFLPYLDDVIKEGLIIMDDVEIIRYGPTPS
jgi:PII-like signaling protein